MTDKTGARVQTDAGPEPEANATEPANAALGILTHVPVLPPPLPVRRRAVDAREPTPSPAPTASASRPITAAGGLLQPPWRPVGNPPWMEP
jgi:hypothetical protein